MAYSKLNLKDGDVLEAKHIKHIEDGIEGEIIELDQNSNLGEFVYVEDNITETNVVAYYVYSVNGEYEDTICRYIGKAQPRTDDEVGFRFLDAKHIRIVTVWFKNGDSAQELEFTPFDSVELDTTLAQSGKAADAKAVGDALSKKLGNDQLTSAINTALAQAKASGDFKGDKPVKGNDYWTSADQESIVQDVITALGTPVFGTVDENCHINLTGKLADGKTYTFTYEDENGVVSTIGTYSKEADESGEVEIEWRAGITIDKTTGDETSGSSNYAATEPIELKDGYTYTLYASGNTADSCTTTNFCYYDADGNYLGITEAIRTYTQTSAVVVPPAGAKTFKIRAWTLTNQWGLLDERHTLMMEKKQ